MLLTMPTESITLIRNYSGALLGTHAEQEMYKRTAPRLGVFMTDLELERVHADTWSNFLKGLPLGTDGESLLSTLHSKITELQKRIEELEEMEHDSGSSSYSDFTDESDSDDSETSSSGDEDDDATAS